MHAPVRSLNPLIQSALSSVGYHKADVQIIPAEKVSPMVGGSDGQRGFILMLNLNTGESKRIDGSWGGANMFTPSNPVDLDRASYPLPPNGVVIKGETGYRVFATVYVPMAEAQKFLPMPREELSKVEKDALYCHRAIKGGAYRREELMRRKVPQSVIDQMVDKGLLKRAKVGVSITTEGKNAVDGYHG